MFALQKNLATTSELGSIVDLPIPVDGFLATSATRDMYEEFIVPEGPDGAAQLRLIVPAGTPAIWVPPLGISELTYQREPLFGPGHHILIDGYDLSSAMPTLTGRLLA